MIRRSFRIGLVLGVLTGLAIALVKVLGWRDERVPAAARGSEEPWPRLATPVEEIVEVVPGPAGDAWVEPADGVCPTTHPVKAKLASKIFHLPGTLNYERTQPDRCYADAAKAEADGLRAAKR